MKEVLALLIVVILLIFMQQEIDGVRAEIVEIKKDYSYDPKDAK
jgi:hypothetical protein